MDIFEAIQNRRSIRQYKSDPLDDATVQKVLEAAHWAPSWGNMQCWRFIVVRDINTKVQIADTIAKVQIDKEWVENAAAAAIKQAPVLIVFCAEIKRSGFNIDGVPLTDKGEFWYLFDVALSVENMLLAAHAQGLGTVIVGGFDTQKVSKILGVPADYTVVTMTPLGVPERKGIVSPRKQLNEVLFKERFTP
jgi:nitroreductase